MNMNKNTAVKRSPVRFKSTGFSSARFGACDSCGTHVADTWIGTWNNGLSYVFGHETCVRLHVLREALAEEAK